MACSNLNLLTIERHDIIDTVVITCSLQPWLWSEEGCEGVREGEAVLPYSDAVARCLCVARYSSNVCSCKADDSRTSRSSDVRCAGAVGRGEVVDAWMDGWVGGGCCVWCCEDGRCCGESSGAKVPEEDVFVCCAMCCVMRSVSTTALLLKSLSNSRICAEPTNQTRFKRILDKEREEYALIGLVE